MKIRATWKKRIWGMALALCITLPALAQPALAAEEYIPGNPRWSGYKNQVQWDKPENAGSSDSFEYEAHLLLEGEVLENQTSEIQPYVFFSSDTVTLPQEEYTIRVRARWIMIVGDPDGQYMVAMLGTGGPGPPAARKQTGRPLLRLAPGRWNSPFRITACPSPSKRIYRRMQSSMPIQWRRKACSAPIPDWKPSCQGFYRSMRFRSGKAADGWSWGTFR